MANPANSAKQPAPPYPISPPGLLIPSRRFQSRAPTPGTPSEDPYLFLQAYDTVFLIDDSMHMTPHWNQLGALLETLAPICMAYDPNGIDMYFVNHRPRGYHMYAAVGRREQRAGYLHIGLARGSPGMRDNVAGIFAGVVPAGRCALGHTLRHLLEGYAARYAEEKGGVRRVFVVVFTAWVVEDDPCGPLIAAWARLKKSGAAGDQLVVLFVRLTESGVEARWFDVYGDCPLTERPHWHVTNRKEMTADVVLSAMLRTLSRAADMGSGELTEMLGKMSMVE
ncbi:hypothetical protein M426DRAFT_323095 [Hypoxylon sp. CI-4A]|nr:hypothetical protein M426DRAFT_323095 [Hypoxylon sp. CI-4A]